MRRIYTQPPRARRLPVTVLGATGLVGQRVIALLEGHPWLELAHIVASERRIGARYGEVVRWQVETPPPAAALDLRLEPPEPDSAGDFSGQLVISALPTDEARVLEPLYAQAGALVFSNASAYRMDPETPLVVPEINSDHLAALTAQRARRGWRGAIITNPNCSTIGLTLALAPLQRFGLRRVSVTTFQAASGAGYPGVAALDLIDNVIPYIAGEEEKLETETLKILGGWSEGDGFAPLAARVSATCARVPVRDGHLEAVSVAFERRPQPEEITAAWRAFSGEPQRLGLPSAPQPAIVYREEPNRPQPLADRLTGDGMAITIGRLRPCDVLDYKFLALSHNTIRGAAGAALLNAELAVAQGLAE